MAIAYRAAHLPSAIGRLGWQHINLTGDYLWGADGSLGSDGFRPLRDVTMPMPAAIAA